MVEQEPELIRAWKGGDGDAFGALVELYADRLLGYLVRLTGSRDQAEELFQETFMRAYLNSRQFKADAAFKPWLFRIASRVTIDAWRKAKRRPQTISLMDESGSLGSALPSPVIAPDRALGREDAKRQVRQAVDTLPPKQRAALVLAYFEGLSYREVAEVLGCSVGTIKTQMSRAMKKLAILLPEMKGAAI